MNKEEKVWQTRQKLNNCREFSIKELNKLIKQIKK